MIEKLKSPHGENHIDINADPQEVSDDHVLIRTDTTNIHAR